MKPHDQSIQIELLQANDLDSFVLLWTAAFQTDPYAFRTTAQKWKEKAPEDIKRNFNLSIASPNFIVGLWSNKTLVGMAGIRQYDSDYFLWGTFVTPSHRQFKLGKKLVITAIDYLQAYQPQATNLHLEVFEAAKEARILYKSLGFVEAAVKENGEINASKAL